MMTALYVLGYFVITLPFVTINLASYLYSIRNGKLPFDFVTLFGLVLGTLIPIFGTLLTFLTVASYMSFVKFNLQIEDKITKLLRVGQ